MIDHAVAAPADRASRPTRFSRCPGSRDRRWYQADATAPAVVTTPTSAAGRASQPASALARLGPASTTTTAPTTAITSAVDPTIRTAETEVSSCPRPSSTTATPMSTIGGTTAARLSVRSGVSGRAVMYSRPRPSM